MAYDGGYAQRGPPPREHYGAPQPYDNYQGGGGGGGGYGYDDYNGGRGGAGGRGGYGPPQGAPYQDPGYGRPPPQQDPYGPGPGGPGRGGRPMPGGRGGGPPGAMPRPSTADPHQGRGYPPRGGMPPQRGRGMPNGPPAGRGGMRPPPQGYPGEPPVQRRPMEQPPMSPSHANFGGNGYGAYPQDQQLADRMGGMDLNPPRMPADGRPSLDSQRGGNDYGRPSMSSSRGSGPDSQGHYPNGGYNEYDGYNGYGQGSQGPPRNDFAPPSRSMTMPVEEHHFAPLQRVGTMPVNGAGGRGMPQMPVQRPSTAGGNRPPPQRTYPPQANQYEDQYGNGQQQYGSRKQSGSSFDDVYDGYFDNTRHSNPEQGQMPHQQRTSVPDFDAIQSNGNRGSFEQTLRPAQEQPQPASNQALNHARSQPNLRQGPPTAYDMNGDVPPLPSSQTWQGAGYNQGYPAPGGFEQPRAPSRAGAASARPPPVRPGLMANSVVNVNDRPPPARNHGGPAPQPQPQHHAPAHVQQHYQPAPPPQQMQPRMQQPPPPQQQQQQQQQPPPPQNTLAPLKKKEPEAPVTANELEHLRMVIKGNPGDQASAVRLAKRLIEAADVLTAQIQDPRGRQKARERYLVDSHKILKKLANAQNPEAMFTMADAIGRSLYSHEPDNKEAFTLYQSAAKLGHASGAYRTAVCCEIGNEEGGGTRRDPVKAMQWYKRAATLGDPPAMYKLGMIQLKGLLGQPKNPREAVGWLKQAADLADAENPHALHELGLLYEQGNESIPRDEPYAYSLFLRAAELGYKFSQYRLGCTFEYGLVGCRIDPRQSIMWYSRAATQEEHQSELALSGWYLTGSEGVLGQSDTEAYLWARKAAVAGLAKAEYAMGYFTEVGIGVPANLDDAKRWYWRAAAQEFPKARDRLEELKRTNGKNARPRERISRSKIERQQQEGECSIM